MPPSQKVFLNDSQCRVAAILVISYDPVFVSVFVHSDVDDCSTVRRKPVNGEEDLIIKENGIVLKGEIRSVGDYLSLVSAVTVKYGALCDRCLEPFDAEMTFEFDRQIVASQKRGDAREDEEEEPLAVEEGKIVIERRDDTIKVTHSTNHLDYWFDYIDLDQLLKENGFVQ